MVDFTLLLFTAIVAFLLGYLCTTFIRNVPHLLDKRDPELNAEIGRILEPLKFDAEKLIKLKNVIKEELAKGLNPSTNANADVKMFPTYVRILPVGSERGEVLALDLGGTNFRVLKVNLPGGGKKPSVHSTVFVVPRSIMQGHGIELFDHLADSLYRFLESHDMLEKYLTLGFTFSFPCTQHGLACAKLSTWTKGFTCEDVVGQDVVKMLQDAIDRKELKVKVTALINDTVGTLVACAYGEPQTAVGLIIGTGFNACYVERLSEVGTWDGDFEEPQRVVINTEWGALGKNGCLDWMLTSYDREVDQASVNVGQQIFEKLVSGMYMGEIVRNILLSLIDRKLLFMGRVESYQIYAAPLMTPGAFLAKYVSDIENDDGINFEKTSSVLSQLGIPYAKYEDCAIIRHVCKLVSRRAGALVAVGLACLMDRIMLNPDYRNEIVIAVDGSLYRYHPKFRKNILKPLNILMSDKVKYEIKLSDDGSGIGAALVAYMDDLHTSKKRLSIN